MQGEERRLWDAGSGMQNEGRRVQGAGCRFQDVEREMLKPPERAFGQCLLEEVAVLRALQPGEPGKK